MCLNVALFGTLWLTTCSVSVPRFQKSTEKRTIPAECMCQFGGKEYDFCYRLPENLSVRGKRMSCASAPILHDLGLLQEDSNEYLDLRRDKMPQPVMVTAFSENHWEEGKRLISTIQRLWPQQLLIVYDLGLDESTARFVRKLCNVEYRKFDYMRYPPYVRRLSHYRWKPILIAETLDQFGSIWYMDTSIVMDKSNLEHIYDLVRCKRNHTAAPPLASIAERDERELSVPHESGWDQKQWRENIRECRKSSYLLHGYTGHGIFPATHPDTYVYIPTNLHEIKKPKAKMYDAGFVFAVKTTETIQNIVKWYVLCALEKNCMGGDYSKICSFSKNDRFRLVWAAITWIAKTTVIVPLPSSLFSPSVSICVQPRVSFLVADLCYLNSTNRVLTVILQHILATNVHICWE
ncbi:unnamed protein product [Toxocara canis]|uniref:Secreted protein n=1 Tax=Toxocara canis TaxID=6265 RepID=A0A183TUX6_TOXCA|nr:unnamed protein product [Toxocara canis]